MTTPISVPLGSPSQTKEEGGIPLNPAEVLPVGDEELTPEMLEALRKKALHGKLVNWIKGEYAKCKTAHTEIRNQWYMNMAFYKGEQYVANMGGTVMKTKAPSHRVRLTINRTKPMVRTEMARMTSQEPNAEVMPASTNDDALLAAEVGQAVWENCSLEYKLAEKKVEASFWLAVCGVGYVKTRWDSGKKKGDIAGCHDYSAPSPFHVLVPELLVKDIEDQPYVLNVFTKPIEWVRQHFGDQIPKDHQPTVISTSEIMESRYLNLKESGRGAEPDACLFIEAWIKPGTHPDLPNGGLITIVDDFIIQAVLTEMPYKHGEYPFTKMDGIPSGGYYGTSAVEDFIQLQQELNRNRSQRSEARNLTAKPQWTAPKGVIDVAKWRNQPGQVIEYTPGLGKPEIMPINPLPSYVIQEEEAILRDMEDVSGQHQVSRGQNPSGVTSGTAISFLQEADNSFMSTVFFSIERGIEKIARQTLQLAVQYWDVPRLIKTTGRDGSFSVKSFRGADIKDGTDIRIEHGSSLPQSRAARNALVMDIASRGGIQYSDALKMMKLPNMKAYFDRVEADQNQARRENQKMREFNLEELQFTLKEAETSKQELMMKLGIEPGMELQHPLGAQIEEMYKQPVIKVNDWDNHEAHMAEHEFFMKSQTFEVLKPEIKEQFERHWQAHKDKLAMDMFSQMMQMEQPEPGNDAPNPEGENQFAGAPESEEAGLDQQQPV